MVATTVNLPVDIKAKLEGAAAATGRSRSWLIANVVKQLVKRPGDMVRFSGGVQYQDEADEGSWRTVHVSFQERDYDLFVDSRKFCRRSVSLLVSIAIVRFLDLLVIRLLNGEYDEEADNYPLQSYAIVQEFVGKAICWKIFWGIPENPEKHLTPIT